MLSFGHELGPISTPPGDISVGRILESIVIIIIVIIMMIIKVNVIIIPGDISVGGTLDREDMAEFNLIVQVETTFYFLKPTQFST